VSEETKAMAQALLPDRSLSIKQILDRLGIAKSTLYKYLDARGKKSLA
jgi:predicted DNA-binding transcriptional regulator AlpA